MKVFIRHRHLEALNIVIAALFFMIFIYREFTYTFSYDYSSYLPIDITIPTFNIKYLFLLLVAGVMLIPESVIPTRVSAENGIVRIRRIMGEREFALSGITRLDYYRIDGKTTVRGSDFPKSYRAVLDIEILKEGKVYRVSLNDSASAPKRKGFLGLAAYMLGNFRVLSDEEIPLFQFYCYIKEILGR